VSDPVKKNGAQLPEAERRRIATIVHDDRGNASVRWRDAPESHERPVLEVLGNPGLSIKSEETFDPYGRGTPRKSTGNTTRTDLRKLSEWIKLMRELEERKRHGGGDDGGSSGGGGDSED
jgi:hypothetical protein